MNYGNRLKSLRNSLDLRQSDMAEILGVSVSAVGNYERCERQPTFEILKKYADHFHVSMDYLLCNSDSKFTVEEYKSIPHDILETLKTSEFTLQDVPLTPEQKQRISDIAVVLLFDLL